MSFFFTLKAEYTPTLRKKPLSTIPSFPRNRESRQIRNDGMPASGDMTEQNQPLSPEFLLELGLTPLEKGLQVFAPDFMRMTGI